MVRLKEQNKTGVFNAINSGKSEKRVVENKKSPGLGKMTRKKSYPSLSISNTAG